MLACQPLGDQLDIMAFDAQPPVIRRIRVLQPHAVVVIDAQRIFLVVVIDRAGLPRVGVRHGAQAERPLGADIVSVSGVVVHFGIALSIAACVDVDRRSPQACVETGPKARLATELEGGVPVTLRHAAPDVIGRQCEIARKLGRIDRYV